MTKKKETGTITREETIDVFTKNYPRQKQASSARYSVTTLRFPRNILNREKKERDSNLKQKLEASQTRTSSDNTQTKVPLFS